MFISRFKKSFQLARVSSKSLLTQLLEKPRNTRVRRRRGEKRLEEREGGLTLLGESDVSGCLSSHIYVPATILFHSPSLVFRQVLMGCELTLARERTSQEIWDTRHKKNETNDEFAHWWSARKTQFSCCFNVPLKGTL